MVNMICSMVITYDADDVAAINKTGLIDLRTLRLYSLKKTEALSL